MKSHIRDLKSQFQSLGTLNPHLPLSKLVRNAPEGTDNCDRGFPNVDGGTNAETTD